ncbi:glycosyltransferase family 57 protein [Pholiota molesta]|nr:glycosyltransferase family 57 protein [Pholiota molesta]
MDELSALPPETSWKRSTRIRPSSLNPRYAYTNPSPSTTRAESPFRPDTNTLTVNTDVAQSNVILAPTPRRHLLESSASQHWLHTPPLSAISSRPSSPPPGFPQSRRLSSTHSRARSFSAVLEIDKSQQQMRVSPSLSIRSGLHHTAAKDHEPEETATGRRWIRWMHKRGIKQWIVPGIIAASTLIKVAIGLGSYSGQNTPPMFGDYEAQRHWMELTVHLPLKQWYTYDLPYWGLDYPPLTAYVSWLCGIVGHFINPTWVALDKSRGIETPESKLFMRMTVLVLDALVYLPALLMFAYTWQGSRSRRTQELSLLTLILQPALLLVDFGHFQYNSVMLGLTILAMNFFATGQDLIGAFFFVLSLGFKQMALYYAPAIGSYLIAKCITLALSIPSLQLFIRLALVTTSTFLLLFLPWLPPFASLSATLQPITRIFPFARGLFEDKVANFWCASNVIFKWKTWASSGSLVKLSTGLTALGFLPAVIGLIQSGITHMATSKSEKNTQSKEQTPFLPLLPYALLTSSMSFFLFSFQVHEKTILLPLLPITLLLSGAPIDSAAYSWGALVNNVAVFSMWPLLKRDGLGIQYIATLLLWNRLIGYNPIRLPLKTFIHFSLWLAVYAAAVALHLLELVVSPPARYPDIFPVLNVLISTPVFFLTWLWSIKCGVEVGWALGGLGNHSHPAAAPERKAEDDAGGVAMSSLLSGNGAGAGLSYRQSGGRTVSLGHAQSSASSLSPVELLRKRESMGDIAVAT